MLTTFDAPRFNQTCTRRDRSNTPLQSLTVANDPTMVEAARALTQRILADGGRRASSREQLAQLFRACLVRPPTEAELDSLAEFQETQRLHFAAHPEAVRKIAPEGFGTGIQPAEGAALVAAARVVLNLDEFITRE
jgi:hypothetical protein